MKKPQKPLSFWVALLLTVVTMSFAYLTYYRMYRPVTVVAAAEDIQAREQIKESQLKTITVSLKDCHPNAVTAIGQAAGKIAGRQIYSSEQIITNGLTDDPSGLSGVFTRLGADETYQTFTASEVKWPNGLKEGDQVVATAVAETGSMQVGLLRVLGTDHPALEVKALQPALPQNTDKITVAVKWRDLNRLLFAKAQAKAFYLSPAHPNAKMEDIEGGVPADAEKPD
ncbi:MAG: hypothetical protein JL50_21605 [Peptococcaceae bacterium BICA1-7]|nr:MAG: hypothetical protein JL50_21605 [Peptococcaceae bacterium BICA1-7]HBV99334.1 hypothetical protein [Desulfotomaculum sp.]